MQEKDNAIFMERVEYEEYMHRQAERVNDKDFAAPQSVNDEIDNSAETEAIAMLTLYSMNQQLIANMPSYDEEKWNEATELLHTWLANYNDTYYMLLCKELSYYTVFNLSDTKDSQKLIIELFDIVKECGTVKDIAVDTNGMIAIWLHWQNEELPRCFYFFPYEAGVVCV